MIHPLPSELTTPETRALLGGVAEEFGMLPNSLRSMAHSPAALAGHLAGTEALAAGRLDGALREQIALRVAEHHGCAYCTAAHTALARAAGLSDEEIADSRLGRSTDRRVEAVLRLTEELLTRGGKPTDGTLALLERLGFGPPELTEIVACIASSVFTNFFNNVARPEIDFPAVARPSAR